MSPQTRGETERVASEKNDENRSNNNDEGSSISLQNGEKDEERKNSYRAIVHKMNKPTLYFLQPVGYFTAVHKKFSNKYMIRNCEVPQFRFRLILSLLLRVCQSAVPFLGDNDRPPMSVLRWERSKGRERVSLNCGPRPELGLQFSRTNGLSLLVMSNNRVPPIRAGGMGCLLGQASPEGKAWVFGAVSLLPSTTCDERVGGK